MAVRTALRTRFRPWHGLMTVVFCVGAAFGLEKLLPLVAGVTFLDVTYVVLHGLLAVVVFQFTVGNLWGYAVEYHNTGGEWTDPVFLAPFAVALLAGTTAFLVADLPTGLSDRLTVGAMAAFWTFVVAALVTALLAHVAAGYRRA